MAHKKTLHGWDAERIWIFYEGTEADLQDMADFCQVQFPGRYEIGTKDMIRKVDFRKQDSYQQAFVFTEKADAAFFKLSFL